MESKHQVYRGRLAPTPSGYLHLGHALTFWTAQERARARGGTLVLRNDDMDRARCKPEFVRAMIEDLRWFGLDWQEGPDVGGPFGPYSQSERFDTYRAALKQLRESRHIYPCSCSRRDIQSAVRAPHDTDDEEPIYPGTCRAKTTPADSKISWRFRVPDGEWVRFIDNSCGGGDRLGYTAGEQFGDFVVWRSDDVPSYQLACVVDDSAMRITEVVRGIDLQVSAARQVLLYRALGLRAPEFYHCPLIRDGNGQRLAKRSESLSLRALRERGVKPAELRKKLEETFAKGLFLVPSLDGLAGGE